MAYPLYRPQRTSFSDHSVLGFQEYNTSSLTGRKRSNQAAELSDVSVDDDVNDNEVQQLGIMKKTGWEKAVEGDDDRQSRKISCSGRRRSSAKGARKEGESQTVSSSTQKGPIITESEAEAIPNVLQREERIDEAQQDPTATSHSSEMPNSAGDSSSSHLETSSSDITVHPSENTRGGEEMATASVSETFDEEREPSLDRERECLKTERVWGMPDWAAELDEVVPGVKVMSIQDAMKVLLDYHQIDTPTSVLFPWLHGIGDGPLGANGPLEQFFGNPPLTPPRYRGLCVLKAPEAPVTLFQDERQSSESMKPLRSSSSASQSSNEPSYSSYNQGSASINIQSPESPASYISRDRAASTSTYLSTISSATWASTDSSDPSLYSLSSSPQSVTTLGTDCEGKFGDASTRNGAVSVNSMSLTDDIDQHEGNAVGQPIEVAMHPTCSKRMLGVETGNRDASPSGNGNTVDSARAHTGSNDIVMDVDMEMEVEFQIPLSVSHDSASLAGTRTPQTSPPPTPQASLSAHPTEENSILRTASGKGRMRSASPTPVNNASPIGRPETLTRASSERNAPSGREDSKSDHVDQTLAAQHRSQIQEEQSTGNQPSTCQNRSMLINAIKTEDILDLDVSAAQGVFKKPDLGGEVSLRNLRIQEIKYASIADLLIYSENGLSNENVQDLRDPLIRTAFSIARAQAKLYQERLASFYSDLKAPPVSPYSRPCDDFQTSDASSTHEHAYSSNDSANVPMNQDLPDEVEGQAYSTDDLLLQLRDREQWQNDHLPERPIMYNVVVIKESFAEIQRYFPELVGTDANGASQPPRDLWVKEAEESIRLAGSSELGENVWLGNGWDDPFRYPGRIRNPLGVDLVIEAHDLADIPTESTSQTLKQVLTKRLKPKRSLRRPIASSRSQNLSPDDEPIYLEVASSSRARQCMQNSHEVLANRLIVLADVICSISNPRDVKANPVKVLVFCDDGYTESSIFALTFLMVSQKLSLREAYLHLQLTCNRSFFVYQFDVPFLSVIERKLVARSSAIKHCSTVGPSSPLSKWKTFGLSASKNLNVEKKLDERLLETSLTKPGDSWINHEKFDGSLPSRILPHVYLGNIAHAMNSEMLKDLGITHVVSVGETLSEEGPIVQGHYINVSGLSGHIGEVKDSLEDTPIKVLEIQDVKDDGNDPLRPKIAHACHFIHQAGKMGGKTLIHCRVGVSRSATIVVAYLMQYDNKSLLDAYLMTRCRRLNVLIQPNLRFLHELLGWAIETKSISSATHPVANAEIVQRYSWPSLCRDLWIMNKKYLVPGDT